MKQTTSLATLFPKNSIATDPETNLAATTESQTANHFTLSSQAKAATARKTTIQNIAPNILQTVAPITETVCVSSASQKQLEIQLSQLGLLLLQDLRPLTAAPSRWNLEVFPSSLLEILTYNLEQRMS
jgi:hypothetical protein